MAEDTRRIQNSTRPEADKTRRASRRKKARKIRTILLKIKRVTGLRFPLERIKKKRKKERMRVVMKIFKSK